MGRLKQRILSNLLSHYTVQLLSVAVAFFLIPFIIRSLGKEAFGTAILAESVILFFELTNLGIRNAMARHVTVELARGDEASARELLATGKYILWGIAVAVFLAGSVLSWAFPFIFRVPPALNTDSRWLFLCITAGFCLQTACAHIWAMLYSKQRMDWINFGNSLQVISKGLLVVLVFTWIPGGKSLAVYGLLLLASRAGELIFIYFCSRKFFSGWSLRFSDFRREKAREIGSLGAFISLQRIAQLLHRNTDHVLINLFWGPAYNAIYEVSLKFAQLLERFFANTTWMLGPSFTELKAQKDEQRFRLLFYLYSKFNAIITMPLCIGVITFAQPLVLVWVGKDFLEAVGVVPFQVTQLLWLLTFSSCNNVNLALARVKIPSIVGLLTAVLNVILSVIFARVFGMGLKGIALGTFVASVINSLFFSPFYACRTAELPFWHFWSRVFLFPLAWVFLVFGPVFAFIHGSGAGLFSWQAAGLGLLGTAIYLSGAYAWLLEPAEKQQVSMLVTAAMNRK